MSLYNVPVLPPLSRLNGQVSIPPPAADSFNTLFGIVLPKAQRANSYWGQTTFYIIEPSNTNPSTEPPRQVILIHGAGTPAIGLLPLATLLAASSIPTTVLIYDTWGHGLSSTPVAPHTPGLFHQQILQLLVHLQWSRAHLLGFSMGGLIAVSFASFYASQVESLTLVAPAGLLRRAQRSAWAQFVEWGGWGWGWQDLSARRIYSLVGPDPVEKDWQSSFAALGLAAIPRDAVQIWERENHAGHIASLVSFWRYGGLFDSHSIYESVAKGKVPTMVVLGENDGFFRADDLKKELQALAWRGKVEVIMGAGHGLVAEKTKDVERCLLEFWGSLK